MLGRLDTQTPPPPTRKAHEQPTVTTTPATINSEISTATPTPADTLPASSAGRHPGHDQHPVRPAATQATQ